ncbi:MAG: hypothetical protein JO036_03055 [Candidatus Eremiobacteraeota bacterium]|nr:hypothetical protein [Candidatus Eremiobacteraeota bacterium]
MSGMLGQLSSVRERIYIEAPYVQAFGAFERRLGLAHGAAGGHCALTLVAPMGEGRAIVRDVTATTKRIPGTANFTSRYGITWDAGQTQRGLPTPGFDGTLTLRAGEDYGECVLELSGRYEPPAGIAGKFFDDVVGRRIAHATLGALLEGVGAELRAAHEQTEAAKHKA